MVHLPIGLQLYSVREEAQKDLAYVLKEVARMGYAGVEFAGYYGHSAPDLRKMLDDLDLKCCGTHTGLHTLLGDELHKTIEFNQTLGNHFLIVPGLPKERTGSQSRLAGDGAHHERDQRQAGAARDEDRLPQPPHRVSAAHGSGELPWDIFFGNTKPEVVMQFDTGNAMHGGAEAGPFLQRYPGRAITVHLKEYSATNDKALIGEGDVKWTRSSTSAKPSPVRSGTSSSRRATPTRRWSAWTSACKTCATWASRRNTFSPQRHRDTEGSQRKTRRGRNRETPEVNKKEQKRGKERTKRTSCWNFVK